MKKDIFGEEKSSGKSKSRTKTTKIKSAKTIVKEQSEVNAIVVKGKQFADALDSYASSHTRIADLKAVEEYSKKLILDIGKTEYCKSCEIQKQNIGALLLCSSRGGSFLLAPSKKYPEIDQKRAIDLRKTYGNKIVTTNTVYEINQSLVDDYGKELIELIKSSKKFPEEVKKRLIVEKKTFSIDTQVLDNLYQLSKQKRTSIKNIVDQIQPVFQIRNPEASNKVED